MKIALFLIVCVLGLGLSTMSAQSIERHVFGTFGNQAVSNQNSVCFTAGEPITRTMTSVEHLATQGFHQPIVTADEKINIYYPNTFNPLSPFGQNTTFHPVYAENIVDYYMVIYSRWRVKIYETPSDPVEALKALDSGWDGSYNGESVPNGAYVYSSVFRVNRFGEIKTFNANGVIHIVK